MQANFFDLNNRHIKFDERDPLIQLNKSTNWEHLRPSLEKECTGQPVVEGHHQSRDLSRGCRTGQLFTHEDIILKGSPGITSAFPSGMF